MSWRIAFLGTFHPAVPTLARLAERGWISVIVVPEDAGDKNTALLEIAREHDLPVSYDIKAIDAHDVNLVLAANYPKLVPKRYLQAYPCVNTHWSALPKYRGVHGTAWALLNGDDDIGVTAHWMEQEFDTGDILAQRFVRMRADMDIIDLHQRLAEEQAAMVLELLEQPIERWDRQPQDHSLATYVPQRVPDDGVIDWSWTTERIWNLVRALPAPMYPGAFTHRGSEKLIIWKARPAGCPPYFATPGQVVRVLRDSGSVWVKTGDACLEVLEVELEGRCERSAVEVLRRGDKLGRDLELEIVRLEHLVAELASELDALRTEMRK